jgi:hypothetical protein
MLSAMSDAAMSVDLLSETVVRTRPMVANTARTTKQRLRLLWAAAKQAGDLAALDVVSDSFVTLAVEANLIDRNGRWTGTDVRKGRRGFGAQDVEHVIRWATRGWNPFEKGPLA